MLSHAPQCTTTHFLPRRAFLESRTGQWTDILTMDYVPSLILVSPPTRSFSLSCTLSFFLLLSFFIIISPRFALFNLSTPYYIAHRPVRYLLYIVAIPYTHLF